MAVVAVSTRSPPYRLRSMASPPLASRLNKLLHNLALEILHPPIDDNTTWFSKACCLLARPSTLLLLICFALSLSHILNRKRSLKLPPGPRRWPILGNLLDLGKLPHRDMHAMFRKYGPIVYLKLGYHVRVVATDDPEIMKEITGKQDDVFSSRPRTIAIDYMSYHGHGLAFAPLGNHWKAMRRICMEHLLSNRRLLSFRKQREEEGESMVREIWELSKQGQTIPLRKFVGHMSMNSVTRMLLGKRFFGPKSCGREQSLWFEHAIHEGMALLGASNLGDYLPALRFLDLQGYERRMKKLFKECDGLLSEILMEHKNKRQDNDEDPKNDLKNFIDVLLLLKEAGEEKLTDTVIKAIMADMISAGTDSSSFTAEWAMAQLIQHPHVCKRAQEELDFVVGRERLLKEEDLSKLCYLRCIVTEILRLSPAIPLGLPHYTTKGTQVAGYDIPKNTLVFMSGFSHGRNKKLWGENAEEFYPDRHREDEIKIEYSNGEDMRHVMFGAGRRRCPGASLGLTLLMLEIGHLLQSFTWELPHGIKNLDMCEDFGVVTSLSTPLIAIATPRLPTHVYI